MDLVNSALTYMSFKFFLEYLHFVDFDLMEQLVAVVVQAAVEGVQEQEQLEQALEEVGQGSAMPVDQYQSYLFFFKRQKNPIEISYGQKMFTSFIYFLPLPAI